MAGPKFKVKPVSYAPRPEPFIYWLSRDLIGITRNYAPSEVWFKLKNFDGLWGNSFRDISVSWNFGDVDEDYTALLPFDDGTLIMPDKNRNTAIGPWTGHVYKTPGTYYPTATLRDSNGNVMTVDGPEVVVTSQDDYYADNGTTYCISRDGDFTGAPAGSINLTTDSEGNLPAGTIGNAAFGTEPTSINLTNRANIRVLFKRGQAQNYKFFETIYYKNCFNCLFGAFGTGDRPVLENGFDADIPRGIVFQDIELYHPFDPTQENKWWTGDETGVEGVDWFPLDPLPSAPQQIVGLAGTGSFLIDNCYLNGAGSFVRAFCTYHNTNIERYRNYGAFSGGVFLGTTITQPPGTPGRPMGTANCSNKSGWNTYKCDPPGEPVENGVGHSPVRNSMRIPKNFIMKSKCFFRGGGGHSADGNIPQPTLRLDNGGVNRNRPQDQDDVGLYVTQCHMVGYVSTSLAGSLYPYGHFGFDSCVFELSGDLTSRLQFAYAMDAKNCLFLARDTGPWSGRQRDILVGPTSRVRQQYPKGNHSESTCRFFNNTIAFLTDGGVNISWPVETLASDFALVTDQSTIPQFDFWNNAWFRADSTHQATALLSTFAPVSEVNQTTYLPNNGTTFDGLERKKYPPLDFDGNVRTAANAIYGFKVKA